jgi:sec-independent protein translocase protein TatA
LFVDILQPSHLIIVLVIALLLFGPSRLPELGRSLGEAVRSFRTGVEEGRKEQEESGRELTKTEADRSKSQTGEAATRRQRPSK